MKLPKFFNIKGFLSLSILHNLKKKSLCGDELASVIGKNRGTKLTPGTIYPALKYMKEKNLIKVKQKGRKKIYTITKKGLTEYQTIKRIFKKMFKDIIK